MHDFENEWLTKDDFHLFTEESMFRDHFQLKHHSVRFKAVVCPGSIIAVEVDWKSTSI